VSPLFRLPGPKRIGIGSAVVAMSIPALYTGANIAIALPAGFRLSVCGGVRMSTEMRSVPVANSFPSGCTITEEDA